MQKHLPLKCVYPILSYIQATAFQFPLGARSRAAAPPAGAFRPASLSARPSVGPLGMTVAPEGLDSLGKTADPGVAAPAGAGEEASAGEAGKDGEAKEGASGSVASAVSAAPPAPAKPEVVDVSLLVLAHPYVCRGC